MRTLLTGLTLADIEPFKEQLADALFRNIPAGVGSTGHIHLNHKHMTDMLHGGAQWAVQQGYGQTEDLERIEEHGMMKGADVHQVSSHARKRQQDETGTLGSGNHHLEIQRVSDIYDNAAHRPAGAGRRLHGHLFQHPACQFRKKLSSWNVRHVIEFRHASWFCESIAACLEEHNISNCLSDAADWPIWHRTTSNLIYIRLHGHSKTYSSAYAMSNLKRWAEFIIEQLNSNRQLYVYFNNDANDHAPRDAIRLNQLIAHVTG